MYMGGLVASGEACDGGRSRCAAACSRPEAHGERDHAQRHSVQLLAAQRDAEGLPAPGLLV